MAVLICISTTNEQETLLLHILISICCQCCGFFTILVGVYWYLVVLTCDFLMTCDVEHLYICLYAICLFSFVRRLFWCFAHFSITLFIIYFLKDLCILLLTTFYQMCLLQIFSPMCSVSSYFPDIVFPRAEACNFNEVQLIHYFFHELCLWCYIEKVITIPKVT